MAATQHILEEIVKQFICPNCDDYLRPPVSYTTQQRNICGPCSSLENFKDSIVGRCHILEKTGKLLKFPCYFHNHGCKLKIPWEEAEHHESKCPFRQFKCPCCKFGGWNGTAVDMKTHVRNSHSDLIITSNQLVQFSLLKNKGLWFLISMEELYVVLYNCDADSGLLWFTLKSVGPFEQAKRRHYRLTLSLEDGEKYYERKQVELPINWEIDEGTAVKVDLCVLRMKLQTKSANVVDLKVEVLMRIPMYNGIVDKGLLQDIECLVCQDYMNAPIFQCIVGHSFCGYCKPKLQHCPTCRASIGESRNFALESIAGKMYYKCLYADDGCSYAALLNDISNHEQNCDYGFIDCPFKGFIGKCSWRGKLDQVNSHTLEEHGLKF